ncbi:MULTISPECIES: DUF1622 domain-containing protein [Micromonospora]|uniref:Uncharacterized membrane protein n=1 Tax=Micromonospora yangpuensis TaxID=683228 RepID=A0A1C6UNA2_9ACTN|nr:DUF1622 domain-containing protein [Micromonospora yangpuensis]GGM28216.1 hypothetical protein GCM10012279_53540 [Micromonospora yangpuensis]SCL55389.1 Uncharacterized membrane protein [Micromonospora yangpuensis]
MSTKEVVQAIGGLLDLAGVLVIAVGVALATVVFVVGYWRTRTLTEVYRQYRQGVGRAILLGLELLVGGDIIRTVAVSPSFRSVGVLALIVLVRTFLSFSLEVELEGRWPWQPRRTGATVSASSVPAEPPGGG